MVPDWKIRVLKGVKRLVFITCHFPALNVDFVKAFIDRPETKPEEVAAYYECCPGSNYRKKMLLNLIYSVYCCKNFYMVYEAFRLFNYDHPSRNIRYLSPEVVAGAEHGAAGSSSAPDLSRSLKQLACMSTNCVRLVPADIDGDLYRSLAQNARLANLVDDLHKLPLFHICHPLIDKFYTPVDKLDSFGVLAFIGSAFNVFLLGVATNLQQLMFPSANETIFFLVAPVVTTRLAVDRTNELTRDVALSYRNFCLNPSTHDGMTRARGLELVRDRSWGPDHLYLAPFEQGGRRLRARPVPSISNLAIAGAQIRLRHLKQRPGLARRKSEVGDSQSETGKGDRETAPDYLPIIRTEWWRESLANILLHTLSFVATLVCLLGVFCFAYIQYRVVKKRQLLALMGAEMARRNCSIWLTKDLMAAAAGNASLERQLAAAPFSSELPPIDVAGLDLSWSLYAMLETSILNVAPGLCVALILAYYSAMVCEIMVWLAELRLFLVATLVVVGFKLPTSANGRGLELPNLSRSERGLRLEHRLVATRHIYNMANLRRKFMAETGLFSLGVFCRILRPSDGSSSHRLHGIGRRASSDASSHYMITLINSKLVDRVRELQFTQEIIEANQAGTAGRGDGAPLEQHEEEDESGLRHDIETIEKIYVNFRMFVEHIRDSASGNATVFSCIYVLNYGLAVVGVISLRKMSNLRREPMFFIVLGLVIANTIIVVGANFHADAKKLQPIIWSMIARMTHSRDARIRHLRFLWLKQVQTLDEQGGLALSAFRMRVTYINILQLAIWTATIIIIAIH